MADKKEYIERGALIRLFDERYITAIVQQKHDDVSEDHKKHWKGVQSGTNWCRNTVLEAPAADVVEVVRCKDCEYWTPMDDGISWSNRRRTDGRCKMLESIHYSERGLTSKDHFCGYGKRKEKT